MATAINGKTMELEGNLKAFQLSDILRFLAMGKMTGLLTFLNQQQTVSLVIKDGLLIGTGSSERFLKLGQMLVYNGLISRKVLDDTLENQRDTHPGSMLGEILIQQGMVTREQIGQCLALQVKEELWELFSWTDGTFKFEHGLRATMKRSMISLEIEPLIEEGFAQMEKWRVISANLGRESDVYRVRPDVAAPPEAKLTPNVWRVLSLLNGRHTVQILVYLSGLGKFETLCAIDKLLGLQLIETVTPKHQRPRVGMSDIKITDIQPRPAAGSPDAVHGKNPNPDGGTGGGLRGLLGIRRKSSSVMPAGNGGRGGEAQGAAQVGPFLTSESFACSLINRLIARLCLETEFMKHEGNVSSLGVTLWDEIGMRFPRADLLQIDDGKFDASLFERYTAMAEGVDKYLSGCHEDNMEALAQIGEELVRRARERLDDRGVRLLQDAVRPYLENVLVTYPVDFTQRLWVGRWLEI